MKFNKAKLLQGDYLTCDIGRLTFGAGYFFRNFNIGLQITKYTITLSLGFFWLDIDWYDKEFLDWDFDWEDTNWDED